MNYNNGGRCLIEQPYEIENVSSSDNKLKKKNSNKMEGKHFLLTEYLPYVNGLKKKRSRNLKFGI